MLSLGWLVAVVVAAIVVSAWVTFTVTRLDRLYARVDAAQAALDAQLVRRAAALRHLMETGAGVRQAPVDYEILTHAALDTDQLPVARSAVENAIGRAVVDAVTTLQQGGASPAIDELREAAVRVQVSRRFYNDAVRDTRALRARRLPRVLHLARSRDLPDFFDIDDTLPALPPASPVSTITAPTITEEHT